MCAGSSSQPVPPTLQVSRSLSAARVPSALRTRRDVAAAAASALLFDDSKPTRGVSVAEANWVPPPCPRLLSDGSVLPPLDFVRAGLRPDFSALIQAAAEAAGEGLQLAAAANASPVRLPARHWERRRSADPMVNGVTAAGAAATSKAARLAIREAFVELRGFADPVVRMDASDLLHGGRSRPGLRGDALFAAAGGAQRRRSMVAALRVGGGKPRRGGRPDSAVSRPNSRGSVASRAVRGSTAANMRRSSSAPALVEGDEAERGEEEEEGEEEGPFDGEGEDAEEGDGDDEEGSADGFEDGSDTSAAHNGVRRASRGSRLRPLSGSISDRPMVSLAEQAATALARFNDASERNALVAQSAHESLALATAIARDIQLAASLAHAATARAVAEQRFNEVEEACAADDDSDVDGDIDGCRDPDARAAAAAAEAAEEQEAIDRALALLASGGWVGGADGSDSPAAALADCPSAEAAIPVLGAAAARLLYARPGTASAAFPPGASRTDAKKAQKAQRRAAALHPSTLALALQPLAAVMGNSAPGNGISDDRAEYLLLRAAAWEVVVLMRTRHRAARLAIQAASARLDRIRMAGMTDAERQRVLQAQQRAKLAAAQVRTEMAGLQLCAMRLHHHPMARRPRHHPPRRAANCSSESLTRATSPSRSVGRGASGWRIS